MTQDKYIFVEVTKTYVMTKEQGKQLVHIARALNQDTVFCSTDDDQTDLSWTGDDYLIDDTEHDYAGAACDIPDPVGLLNIEEVGSTAKRLSQREVDQITARWPKDWSEKREIKKM